MLRRLSLILFFLLLLLIQLNKNIDQIYLFFAVPFFFLAVFYFIVIEDRLTTQLTIGFCLFLIALAWARTQNSFYPVLALVLIASVAGVKLDARIWDQKLEEIRERKTIALQEKQALEERFQMRMENLNHLEKRVSGLIHLFEIARDFNECLDFSQLLNVLDQKIVPELSFARGALILIESRRLERAFAFGTQKRTDKVLFDAFAQECLKNLSSEDRVTKFEFKDPSEQARFISLDVKAPLWLFPLLVERQLIAILAIEGGDANDFQKFEVLASQLALQVKKIKLYETVKENSIVDGLTKVFVRRHFYERFQEELIRAFRYQFSLSVLMVDVDHFKSYNDKFGHLIGDRTLREVAQVIRDNVRRVDVIGRYGGEEFVVVTPEIKKSEALELAERIRSAIARRSLHLYDEETHVTVSIGLSSFPEDITKKGITEFSESFLQHLIQMADKALYRAKEEGRNRVVAYTE